MTRLPYRNVLCAFAAAAILATALPLLAQDPAPAADTVSAAADEIVGGSAFFVTDIEVDVIAGSAQAARVAAFREASRRAWPQLWARMTGTPVASAPRLPDSVVEGMVSGVEVQRERFSTTRYIATLGVVFDRNRAGERLPASARILQSAPMLLLPVFVDAGVSTVFEARSPWQQAWARLGTDSTPMDYVRPSGTPRDGVLLTSWQARRDNRVLWRSILSRYGAENLLIAEAHLARSYPGGPITGTFLARHGPDSDVLTRFRLRAGAAGELDAMLDAAVRRIDGAYARALQNGTLMSDPALTLELAPIDTSAPLIGGGVIGQSGTLLFLPTPDAATYSNFQAALRGVAGVESVSLVSLQIGGTSQVQIVHGGDFDSLRYALDQRGYRLDAVPGGMAIRRRSAGEGAVLPPGEADVTGPLELIPDDPGQDTP